MLQNGPAENQPAGLLTVILLVQALEDQPQLLLVVLQVMNEFFKVQLAIQILISSFYDFLQKGGGERKKYKNNLDYYYCSGSGKHRVHFNSLWFLFKEKATKCSKKGT